MRKKSGEIYKKTIKRFPSSKAVWEADLGLMRIAYRNGDWKGVAEEFKTLDRLNTPDSLKFHAYYLMSCTYEALNENKKASELFAKILPEHPTYIFAQHSLAVAAIRLGNKQDAFLPLENCVRAPHGTPAEEEIFNRSLLFLGYLSYENNLLLKAVKSLKAVSKDSYYYTDALLGLGWTAVKARQAGDCKSVGRLVSKACPFPVIRCEGKLIEAYGHSISSDDKSAITVLGEASDILDSLSGNSPDTMAQARIQNGMERADYDILAEKADEMSLKKQTSDIVRESDGLHGEQKTLLANLEKFLRFSDEFSRAVFFGRTRRQVVDDVNYFLAKLKMHGIKSGQAELKKESEGQSRKIDDTIEKLQQKLKEIDSRDSVK
jgi:tetratricopeptide (TPR) repeat protein